MPPVDRKQLESRVAGVFDQVVAWRRHIHQHPELSNMEFNTVAYIEGELREMDPEGKYLDIKKPVPTGLVVDMKGHKPAGASKDKIILLRADIDALPVEETADVQFKSKTPGVMHACGHDSHAAMLLGAVKLLLEDVDEVDGTVRFLFQPAEEMPPGGCGPMIEAGCLEGVTMAFSQHVLPVPDGPTGTVMLREGAFMCSGDAFDIKVIGKGGHASMPELAVDPIAIAGQVIGALQSLVTRRLPSSLAPVLTVTSIASCTDTYNVIPDYVSIKGTVRSTDAKVRVDVIKYIPELLDGITMAFGATYEFVWHDCYHLTFNHREAYEIGLKCAKQFLPSEDQVVILPHAMKSSEDFSLIAERVPSNYVGIGSYNPAKGCIHAPHSPHHRLDEECFKVGVANHYTIIHQILMQ